MLAGKGIIKGIIQCGAGSTRLSTMATSMRRGILACAGNAVIKRIARLAWGTIPALGGEHNNEEKYMLGKLGSSPYARGAPSSRV